MPGRPIPLVLIEPVLRVSAVVAVHDPVARHLRDDRGRRDRGRHLVALLDRQDGEPDARRVEAVGQDEVGACHKPLHGGPEQGKVRHVQAPAVDPPGERPGHADADRLRADPVEPEIALPRREHLRVCEPLDIERLGQDHRRRDQRTRERSPPGLVRPGHQPKALGMKAALVVIDRPAGRVGTASGVATHPDRSRSHRARLPLGLRPGQSPCSNRTREGGQMMTNARPITLFTGMYPN